eukprot:GHVL01023566.1.p1 GENE.GHVL01023566.1~~GHVL01023566.1.p1  ORF type:complete len:388 (+),score=60.89 GHVL01023566.1:442-1605(+)
MTSIATPLKLFVGSIPAATTEDVLKSELQKHGRIENLFYNPDTKGTNRGWAFANCPAKEDALAIIAAMDRKMTLPGGDKCVEVRFADKKNPAIGGLAAPQSAVKCPWVTYETQDGHRYYYNVVTSVTTWDKPPELDRPPIGGGMGAPGVGTGFGPAGCNVYIFHLPPEWSEQELVHYFSSFGNVVGVRVPRDDQTLRNKGYAFVSFDSNRAALNAVVGLNGLSIGGKWLKVTLKKGEENFYPPGFPQGDSSIGGVSQGNDRTIVEQQKQFLQSIGMLDHSAQTSANTLRQQFINSGASPMYPYGQPAYMPQQPYQQIAGYPPSQQIAIPAGVPTPAGMHNPTGAAYIYGPNTTAQTAYGSWGPMPSTSAAGATQPASGASSYRYSPY